MKTLLVFMTVMALSGCTVQKEFVIAVDGYSKVILPEYKKYVQTDTALSANTKRIRNQSADKFQQLIDEAMKK